MFKNLWVFIFLTVTTQGVFGQEIWHDFKTEMTLLQDVPAKSTAAFAESDLVRRVLVNNQELRVLLMEWKEALHHIVPAKSLDQPELSYSYYKEEVETKVGAQKQSLGLMQRLPFPGKLAHKGQIALQVAKQKQAVYEFLKLKTIANVKQTYYELAYVSDAIRVTELNQKLLKDLEQVAQTKYKSGMAKNQDLLKAQVELGKITDEWMSLKEYLKVLQSKLKAVLNWPQDLVFDIKLQYPDLKPWDDAKQNDIHNNLELRVIAEAIEEGGLKKSLAKLNYLPDFSVGVTYIQTDQTSAAVADNGKDPLIAQIKVSLPIWLHKNKEEFNGAEAFKMSKEKLYQERKNQIESRLQETIFKIKDAQRKMDLYQNALVPKADQALKTIETNYRSGNASFLDLIDSQRMLLAFQLGYYRAKANCSKEWAELNVLLGGSFHG